MVNCQVKETRRKRRKSKELDWYKNDSDDSDYAPRISSVKKEKCEGSKWFDMVEQGSNMEMDRCNNLKAFKPEIELNHVDDHKHQGETLLTTMLLLTKKSLEDQFKHACNLLDAFDASNPNETELEKSSKKTRKKHAKVIKLNLCKVYLGKKRKTN